VDLTLPVSFDPGDACFNGHFPGSPVVPGTLVVGLCLEAVRSRLGHAGPLTVRRFSFARFAAPGAYELRIEDRGGEFACTLSQGATVFARGRIAP
jgi:3-hydroxyacyl-[acyl-carrier-protein] dehydratase